MTTVSARSSSARVAVNRWLPGSIELFTPEFFKMPKDLPPGEINAVADSIACPPICPPGNTRCRSPSWMSRRPPWCDWESRDARTTAGIR